MISKYSSELVRRLENPIAAKTSGFEEIASYQFPENSQSQRLKGPNVKDLRLNQVQGILLESKIIGLQNYYKILRDFQVSIHSLSDQVNEVPACSIAIYAEHLNIGFCFLFHPFIIKVFNLYKVVPVQLISNTF